MRKLLLLFLVMPSILFSALPQNPMPEPVEGNPFTLLKELLEGNTSNEGGNDTNKPEETVQTKETTKLIFPSDIEGAEEIYEDPNLAIFDMYGVSKKLYQFKDSSYYDGNNLHDRMIVIEQSIDEYEDNEIMLKKIENYCLPVPIDKAPEEPGKPLKNYETNTSYTFIKKLDKKIIFDNDLEQRDIKIYPEMLNNGQLKIKLDAIISGRKYFETSLYVTFSVIADSSCVTRTIDRFWYNPNEVTLIKEEPETKKENYYVGDDIQPLEAIRVHFDGINTYYVGYSLHDQMIASNSADKSIIIECPSCTEQKRYPLAFDVDSYKKKVAENLKNQEKIKFDQSVAPFKLLCEEIGFTPGTDKFKNCLVEMMN
ncbi:hypothetical protein N9542_03870 [Methylophilaceae bacterium]|nr:hypothetical protein [Methylophilaceae bacterium]